VIRLRATTARVSLEEIAKIYRNNIWKIYRTPKKILSNKKPQFFSRFIKDLSKTLEMKQVLLMA